MMKKLHLCLMMAIFLCMTPGMKTHADETQVRVPRLVDDADLMIDQEEEILLNHLNEISERHQCDVIVLTTDSFDGMRAQDFADDYFDYNDYGMGENDDGILFAVSMGEREWAFSTYGYGIDAFTDLTLEHMEELIIPYLSGGDYYGAFLTYADEADKALEHARILETGDYTYGEENPYYEEDVTFADVLIGLVLFITTSVIIGTLLAFFQKKRAEKQYSGIINNSREMTKSYASNMNLTQNQVLLVNRGVLRTHSPKKKDGGSKNSHVGSSSIHRSSSGRSHGGRSGKF